MDHNIGIVLILTIGFAYASLLGYCTQRIGLPTILGYLLAGFIIGPYSPGFVADAEISEQLAEIGVILMLFGVGLHFKLEDLIKVKNTAIPGAILQTVSAALATMFLVYAIGYPMHIGLIIGLGIGVASTVVLVRALTENNLLTKVEGHIAIGWTIVEDIFTVIILILLPSLALVTQATSTSPGGLIYSLALALVKFAVLVFIFLAFGQKIVSKILTAIARLRSHELLSLTVLALTFVIASASAYIFGTSIALGAFIAGLVIGKTEVRHQAAANALPLKDMFAIMFFLSVGMLFNPAAIVEHFALFSCILFVVLLIKPLSAFLLTFGFGYSLKVALTVALALAQIGEFSFILAEEASNLKMLPDEGFDIIVAVSMISIALNPALFSIIPWLEKKMLALLPLRKDVGISDDNLLFPDIVVVGFGPIGKEVYRNLNDFGFSAIVIEENIDTVSKIEHQDFILFGDASQTSILKAAHIESAHLLVITIPNTQKSLEILHAARLINPNIDVLTRVRHYSEKSSMIDTHVHMVCSEEEELKAFTTYFRKILNMLKTQSMA